ncbi:MULTISPECIES: hypothetical protein [Pseudomonas]|jgi:hypothetical protein|uniref:Uncharacterized protein n=1 Tax=Pseudomonas gingeri TaxID=117681 RepID=A0A7Y7WAG8_9PSED|nr:MULTISPECIES: hypothetical protein [Pseudomonas]MCU1735765.1 hypothetical protein [Pseudomonas sp. 20S_6.2_Bac1]NWB45561.1 hypothetical protein [Pseudomonas gingeri]
MKNDPSISAQLAKLEPNQVGLLAWSLLAYPQGMASGIPGIPGQPDPDTPQPSEPFEPSKPSQPPPERGVPEVPDETGSPTA